MFKQFIGKYFSFCTNSSDTFIKFDEQVNFLQSYHKDTSQDIYSMHYFGMEKWHSSAIYSINNQYLLKFSLVKETDSTRIYDKRFLLCDVCGNILDSLILRKAEYEDIHENEVFSLFHVKADTLKWSYYDSWQVDSNWLCTTRYYIIGNDHLYELAKKIKQRAISPIVW